MKHFCMCLGCYKIRQSHTHLIRIIITLMMKVLVLMFGVSLVSSNDVVTWEYLPLPSQDNPWGLESQLGDILPKYTTVFGIPVFGGAEVTVRR